MLIGDTENTSGNHAGKRDALTPKKPSARSRVGNGKALLSQVDLRGVAYREYCDVAADLAAHMGGADRVTAVERAILEEASGMIVWCRQARAALLNGKDFSVGDYAKAVNCLRRLLEDIGQQPRLKDVTPSISAYVKAFEVNQAEEVEG
jgi:hypothetical protein